MASQGPQPSGTIVDDPAVGTNAWANVSQANGSDDLYASAGGTGVSTTHYLKCTNFGFSIPDNAVIETVKIKIERLRLSGASSPTVDDNTVKLVIGGSVTGSNKPIAGSWSATDTVVEYNYTLAAWGVSLTPTQANASDFGFVINVDTSGTNTNAGIDHVAITITYVTVFQSLTEVGGMVGPEEIVEVVGY
jgi:hypothetical protein